MPSAQPNIIFVLSDQHRWNCAGFNGNLDVRTPNLDSLAAHGLNFPQTICQYPLCVPSRMTLLTGQYPDTHGVHDNRDVLPVDAATFPRILQGGGYQTAAIGKMHFTPARAAYGFDVMRLAEQDGPGRHEDDYHAWLQEEGVWDDVDWWDQVDREKAPPEYWDTFGAMTSNLSERHHSTTWIGNQAVRYIQEAKAPFFLWVGFIKPHHPFDPPAEWAESYDPDALTLPLDWRCPVPEEDVRHGGHFDLRTMDEKRFRRVLANYYATISHMDHQIGRILATLNARGHTNNVVVYSSDHGDYMGQHGLIVKGKAQLYDSVLRVPLVIAGVTGQRRGETDPALGQLTDLAPTFLDAAGLTVPDTMEGKSLLPQLQRRGEPLRAVAYSQRDGLRVARGYRYKWVESGQDAFRALYDLQRDPGEFHNLRDDPRHRSIQAELAAAIADRFPGSTTS
jgi:arylsulfatase A-like enzyme